MGPRPPRIVFLTHVARPSGAEIALVRLINALGQEIDAHVVLGEDGPLVRRLRDAGATVRVLPMHPGARDTRKDTVRAGLPQVLALVRTLAYIVRLTRVLRALRPDVVHANSLKACLYGGVSGRLARVPVVWHVRDRIADDYLPGPAVRLVRVLGRLLPSTVIFNSESTRRAFGDGLQRSWVVHNAVVADAVEVIASAVHEQSGLDLVVGVVGRLAPWKGQDVFLRAFAEAFPHDRSTARLIGSAMFGEHDYEADLRGLVVELGLGDRVQLRGFRDDIASELAELDVLVHCSTLPEPFGQVVVEALAAGVPVIAADAGGPAEIITDGIDGLLTPPGDVLALSAALQKLHADPALRAQLAERGLTSAARFSPSVLSARLLEVYATLLTTPAQRRGVTSRRRPVRGR